MVNSFSSSMNIYVYIWGLYVNCFQLQCASQNSLASALVQMAQSNEQLACVPIERAL